MSQTGSAVEMCNGSSLISDPRHVPVEPDSPDEQYIDDETSDDWHWQCQYQRYRTIL